MINYRDFLSAYQSLRKSKGYSFSIVLTLGITLGALVAMFNLNYQILAAPLPYPDAERLYIAKPSIYVNDLLKYTGILPYAGLVDAYVMQEDFTEHKALVKLEQNIIRNLADTPLVNISYVTSEYLDILQAPLALGRLFNSTEGLYSQQAVAVISYQTWQREFHKNPDVLSDSVQIGDVSFKIIGVLAQDFIEPQLNGVRLPTELWLPWDFGKPNGDSELLWQQFKSNQFIVGKLNKNQLPAAVEQGISQLMTRRYAEVSPLEYSNGLRFDFKLLGFKEAIMGDVKRQLLLLLAGAFSLLSLAVINIANLMLARVGNQQKSLAIKAAIGAQRSHLFNGLVAEVLILILASMSVALVISLTVIAMLKAIAINQFPRLTELHLSSLSFMFTIFSGCVLAIIFSLAVARYINYRGLNKILQSGSKGAGVQMAGRVRALLIFSQTMFSVMILVFSLSVLHKALVNILQPLGFSTDGVFSLTINTGVQQEFPVSDAQKIVIQDFVSELMNNPKVMSASVVNQAPISSNQLIDFLSISADYLVTAQALLVFIDESYFDLLGVSLLHGRMFSKDDFVAGSQVIVISESFAKQLQKISSGLINDSSINNNFVDDGKAFNLVLNNKFYFRNGGDGREVQTVIGIVKDFTVPNYHYSSQMFVPTLAPVNESEVLIKLNPDQELSKYEINAILKKINYQYSLSNLISIKELHADLLSQDVIAAGLTLGLTLLALFLSAIGIYGVLSYSVQLRQFELGIRMAIGACPRSIFIKIFSDNIASVIAGIFMAIMLLLMAGQWVQKTSYEFEMSAMNFIFPVILMLTLAAVITLLSVWSLIRKPACFSLKGN